ncbi:hypothetical protein T459_13074 [Capsicum annuum]|uniref:Uncharacterized protein n=1 Tax=Capsicum annuum TaxID=4072 RepID=A0A2G2ZRR0_CAPAN|nr:serine carboxypeptidase-like 18 isoform X2 [Capsicum annuum]PHT84631.1 hypothetical protein T459_13074 [Capsicum annuum]
MDTLGIMKKLLLKLCVLVLLHLLQRTDSHYIVDYLPGLPGRLPFHLETGYVGIGKDEEVQLFYYFLQSESNPTTDPLLIWLSGGPGCSSVIAIVNEIGPLRFAEQVYNGSMPSFVLNPHAWTKIASVIFLDQPVNTGFSYATNSAAYKYTDVQACKYVYEFLRKWLSDHPQFISNPFYISGNSYSGMTIPVIAQFISNGNTVGKEPLINLQGYLLGNPLTFSQESNYHIPFCLGMGLIPDELYKSLEMNCRGEYIREIDPNNARCANDVQAFNQMVRNINVEHVLKPFCKSDDDLLRPHRILFGERVLLDNSSLCNVKTSVLLIGASIWGIGLITLTSKKLFMFGSGDHDLMVPFQSTQVWIKSLNYSIDDDWRPWNLHNQIAGEGDTQHVLTNLKSVLLCSKDG